MQIKLTQELEAAIRPVFQAMPLTSAMELLVVEGNTANSPHAAVVEQAVAHDALRDRPELRAALWLYVDELDRSHTISQGIEDATGSYWHGIMHRREGDFSNSHYWFRRVGKHPAMSLVGDGYDADALIDDVQRAHDAGQSPAALVQLQRQEWATLFNWCVAQR